jgi:hypothetical protein
VISSSRIFSAASLPMCCELGKIDSTILSNIWADDSNAVQLINLQIICGRTINVQIHFLSFTFITKSRVFFLTFSLTTILVFLDKLIRFYIYVKVVKKLIGKKNYKVNISLKFLVLIISTKLIEKVQR